MADIVFRYVEMRKAAEDIRNMATKYQQASGKFVNGFNDSIAAWEGDSQEKMKQFVNAPVQEYMGETVPQLLNAFADLLDTNADQMEKADSQIAESIPTEI